MSYSLGYTPSLFLMLYVSGKIQQGKFEFIPTQQIANDLNIPPSSASALLRRLSRAQIIETREGALGGVRLARPPNTITLLDLLTAIEQDVSVFQTQVQLTVTGLKPSRAQATIHEMLGQAELRMKQYLGTVTVQDLIDAINQ